MENNQILLKVSRLFPSSLTSCQFRTLPDVAESSITVTKSNKLPHEKDLSSSVSNKAHKFPHGSSSSVPKPCKRNLLFGHSYDTQRRKPGSTLREKHLESRKRSPVAPNINPSSSSHGGWFSSSEEKTRPDNDDVETDTFFSLSSFSADSFRLKTSRRFRRREEMKSIDETGRCSFSSVHSFDTALSKCSRKTAKSAGRAPSREVKRKSSKIRPEYELGPDHVSTQLYYAKNGDPGASFRPRKSGKNHGRKVKKSPSRRGFGCVSMIEESYAVEKSSRDPRSDFRASMVEMIVEKQMFAAEDLERLLLCFLSLNSVSYHGLIFDVFSEICETLFCN